MVLAFKLVTGSNWHSKMKTWPQLLAAGSQQEEMACRRLSVQGISCTCSATVWLHNKRAEIHAYGSLGVTTKPILCDFTLFYERIQMPQSIISLVASHGSLLTRQTHSIPTGDDQTPNSPVAMVGGRPAAASLLPLLSILSVMLTCSLFCKDDLTFSSKLPTLLAQHDSSLSNQFSNWSESIKWGSMVVNSRWWAINNVVCIWCLLARGV